MKVWNSSCCLFSSKSAYWLICSDTCTPPFDNWSWIWKVPTTPRVSHFLRLAVQERLATKDYLCFRHITTDNFCHICSDMTESTLHVLRHCPSPSILAFPLHIRFFSLIFFSTTVPFHRLHHHCKIYCLSPMVLSFSFCLFGYLL